MQLIDLARQFDTLLVFLKGSGYICDDGAHLKSLLIKQLLLELTEQQTDELKVIE